MEAKPIHEIRKIEGLAFPDACLGISFTPSGNQLLAIGIYKPSIRFYSLKNCAMIYERHFSSNPLKIISLHPEGEKYGIFRQGGTVEFHVPGGTYESVRFGNRPTDCVYDRYPAELLVSGADSGIERLSLERGQLMGRIEADPIDILDFSEDTRLLFGAKGNQIAFFDTRCPAAALNSARVGSGDIVGISIKEGGVVYSTVDENGAISTIDVRSNQTLHLFSADCSSNLPCHIKYNKGILLCSSGNRLGMFSGGERIGEIKEDFAINAFDSRDGVVFLGGEDETMKCYYTEMLGDRPRWCPEILVDSKNKL